jgi:hypothetical protein
MLPLKLQGIAEITENAVAAAGGIGSAITFP